MEIVDAQLHRPLPRIPWPEFDTYTGYTRSGTGGGLVHQAPSGETQLMVSVELLAAQMEAAGVDAAIVHADQDFCAAAVNRMPDQFAGVLDFFTPDEISDPTDFIGNLRSRPGMLGIRISPGVDYNPNSDAIRHLVEGRWDPVLAAAQKHEVPIIFYLPLQLKLLAPVARKFADLRVIVEHCGMPAPPVNPPLDDLLETLPELLALAEYENVAVKLTGLPVLRRGTYPFTSLRPTLNRLIEAFSRERLLWGSDVHRITGRAWQRRWPVEGFEKLNYAEVVGWMLYNDELSESDKRVILGEATRTWYRWPRRNEPAAPVGATRCRAS